MPGYVPANCLRLLFTLSFYISPVLDMDVVATPSSCPCIREWLFFFFVHVPDFFVSSIIPAIALLSVLLCTFLCSLFPSFFYFFFGSGFVPTPHCMFTFGVTGKWGYRLSAWWNEGCFLYQISKNESCTVLFVWK